MAKPVEQANQVKLFKSLMLQTKNKRRKISRKRTSGLELKFISELIFVF
jgi:hypothetical protein